MLDFPAAPTNGQQYIAPNGVTYQWLASPGLWLSAPTAPEPDSGFPTGPAGGDLVGTYPSPSIKPSVQLTGVPTAPTAAAGDNTTTLATTAHVKSYVASFGSIVTEAPNTGLQYGRQSLGWTAIVPNPTSLPPSGAAGGALTGTYPNPTLVGGPLSNYALAASIPTSLPPSGVAGGDLGGSYPNPSIKPGDIDGKILTTVGGLATWAPPAAGGGTVTSVSVVSANGLAGTVTNPTLAPAITLRTTVTGLLKGDGTAISAALAGTDYLSSTTMAGGDLTSTYPNPVIKNDVALAGAPTLAITTPLGSNGLQIATSAFVKGQGYLTTTVAGTTYLALAGGTLTGPLLGTTATFSSSLISTGGNITASGGFVLVDRAGDATAASVDIRTDAGFLALLDFRTATTARWRLQKNNTAEGGSNAGSDFQIQSFNDAGSALAIPLTITRSTGVVTLTSNLVGTTAAFSGEITAATPLTADNDTTVATTAWVKLQGYSVGSFLPLTGGALTGDLTLNVTSLATTPVGITIMDLTTSSAWVIDQIGAGITFSSNDASGVGIGPRLRFGQGMTAATGSASNFVWAAAPVTAGTMVNVMTLGPTGVLSLTGALLGTAATFQGNLITQAGVLSVDRTGDATNADFYISADAGFFDQILLRTGTTLRWNMGKTGTAEAGSNAGSDFYINAYSDAGSLLAGGAALQITRSTGFVGINGVPTVRLDVQDNVAGTHAMRLHNAHASLGVSTFVQSAGARSVSRVLSFASQYMQEVASAGILTRYSDFDTQYFRTGAGVNQATISSNALTVLSPNGSGQIVCYHDNTNGFIRSNIGGFYLGAAGSSVVGITSTTTVVPTSDAAISLGTSATRWAIFYSYHGDYIGNLTVGTGSRKATFTSSAGSFQNLALNFTDNNFVLPLKLQNLGVTGANQGPGISFDFGNDGTNVISGGYIGCFSTDTWVAAGNRTSKYVFALPLNGAVSSAYDMSWQAFRPAFDNGATCGASGFRWSVVWAGTGTISTSGADEKTEIGELSEAERRAAQRIKSIGPRRFKFKDAVAAKGGKARWHIGYVAEDVRDALAAENLDPHAYGMLCADEVDGAVRYGLRYDELRAFLELA